PYYMSPEQWGEIPRDENTEIDGRADIYSLGLVFYELILGRRCFSGNTLHELRREHVATRPRPLHEVVPDVPRGFSDAIERATAKDRGDRQATAGALANELRAGLETPATPITGQSSELTETVAIERGVQTNSDVDAPTIITVDAIPTSPRVSPPAATNDATVYEPARPQPAQPSPDISATVAESAAMASSVTVPQVARPAAPEVAKVPAVAPVPASKSKVGLLVGVGVVFVLFVALGVGGFLYWKSRSNVSGTSTANVNTPPAPVEISRYWLELEPAVAGGQTTKVARPAPIASGQSFKFYFIFNEDGYLYIFGPGGNTNEPTAFLTTKPLKQTGVSSNQVSKGIEFSFPSGAENSLTLDENPGTDNFTVIFVKTPLAAPSFLNEQVTGEPLPASQQADLKAFVARYQDKQPVTEVDESNARAPFVRVKALPDQTNNPIVFEIRIQHN
ncbi:MAG TPA: hypothetical protein VF435_00815, partial [Pyrinomonadaceae bacterium]